VLLTALDGLDGGAAQLAFAGRGGGAAATSWDQREQGPAALDRVVETHLRKLFHQNRVVHDRIEINVH